MFCEVMLMDVKNLVSITDAPTNSLIVNGLKSADNAQGSSYWIGLTTSATGNWSWIDGTQFNYANWAMGKILGRIITNLGNPKAADGCATLNINDGKWYSAPCQSSSYPNLCEFIPGS